MLPKPVKKIIEYAFKKLDYDYLGAACDSPNHDSVRVLERLGMEQVQEVEIDGKDTLFFRLDRER
ncbi:MAG: GNAT family N-acetyltransferase [Bacteroidia bacterium]